MQYDVAVIGAGVSGCAAARALTRAGARVVVLEREEDVASGASKANSAIVHAGFDCTPGSLMATLNVRGNAMMAALCEQLSVPYKPIGSYVLAFDQDDVTTLHNLLAQGRTNGVPGLSMITGEQMRERETHISDQVCAALWAPSAAIVCPFELTLALLENAVQNGATFLREFEVSAIARGAQGFALSAVDGRRVQARFVVNAAGLYADDINALAGGEPFTIAPRKGEYMMLDREVGATVGSVIFQTPSRMGKGVLVAPTVHGNLYAGPTAQDVTDKRDTLTTPEGLKQIRESSRRSVPGLALNRVITAFAGLRAIAVGENDFRIRAEGGVPGFINVAGICSPGLTSSPAIGDMVVELLRQSGMDCPAKADFNPRRGASARLLDMTLPQRQVAVAADPLQGRIICRCETVSEAQIVAALHSPVPARSLDGVKRRTGAGMGRCQGGFCTPRVMQIMSREMGVPLQALTKCGGKSYLVADQSQGGEQA